MMVSVKGNQFISWFKEKWQVLLVINYVLWDVSTSDTNNHKGLEYIVLMPRCHFIFSLI